MHIESREKENGKDAIKDSRENLTFTNILCNSINLKRNEMPQNC